MSGLAVIRLPGFRSICLAVRHPTIFVRIANSVQADCSDLDVPNFHLSEQLNLYL